MQRNTGYPSETLTALTNWWPLYFFHPGEPQAVYLLSVSLILR